MAPQYITLAACTAVTLTHWEITLLRWWKWRARREKRSKLLIGGWSPAKVWLFGKWVLLRYISWRAIWQRQCLFEIIHFVIEAECLRWGVAIEGVFFSMAAPSELSVFPHKKGSGWGHRFVFRHISFSVHSFRALSRDRSPFEWSRLCYRLSSWVNGWYAEVLFCSTREEFQESAV